MKLTRRLWVRLGRLLQAWPGPSRRVDARSRRDLEWTCPDCSVRHETILDPGAEAGRIVEVNCGNCGARHEASVFFPLKRPGETRRIVGIVWL